MLKNNRKNYLETIVEGLKDYSYRNKRYQVDFAVGIGLCEKSVDFSEFVKNKRKTDELILLEDNMCCAIFDCAPAESAIMASSNMLVEFKNRNPDKHIYTSVVSSKDYDGDRIMINSLFDILEYAVENNMPDVVMDKQQIEIPAILR